MFNKESICFYDSAFGQDLLSAALSTFLEDFRVLHLLLGQLSAS